MRFLLVDRIIELDSGKRAKGLKNVTLSEDFFTHHFPDQPIMPGAMITECLVQLADWVVRESSGFERLSLPLSFDRIKFHRLVRPGDQLVLEVELDPDSGDRARVRGKASCDGKAVAAAQFTVALEASEPFQSPANARSVFEMLQPPAERNNAKF